MHDRKTPKVHRNESNKNGSDCLPPEWEHLLYSYPFSHATNKTVVRIPPQPEQPGSNDVAPSVAPDISNDGLERRFGDGHFSDRKKLLIIALDYLPDRVDRPNVIAILKHVRNRHFVEMKKRKGTIFMREHMQRRDLLVKDARQSLTGLRHWFDEWGRALDATRTELIGEEDPVLQHINAVLSDLDTVPAFQPQSERLFKRGAQAAPWIQRAEKELINAGVPIGAKGSLLYVRFHQSLLKAGVRAVPRNLPDALLMSLGVVPHSSKK